MVRYTLLASPRSFCKSFRGLVEDTVEDMGDAPIGHRRKKNGECSEEKQEEGYRSNLPPREGKMLQRRRDNTPETGKLTVILESRISRSGEQRVKQTEGYYSLVEHREGALCPPGPSRVVPGES
eukprot:1377082-Amorphochlora_amoeboformis.AAC.1